VVRICFVCLGNICRSPTAEAVMRHLVGQVGLAGAIEVDSAGTGEWHVGELRDRRSRQIGEQRGIPLTGRARQFVADDFARFDYVVAMDRQNHRDLLAMAPSAAARAKVSLLRSFEPAADTTSDEHGDREPERSARADVPDPYYGGTDGFDRVFDICTAACGGLLEQVRRQRRL
jgi:protein-tyrosine phosphatase